MKINKISWQKNVTPQCNTKTQHIGGASKVICDKELVLKLLSSGVKEIAQCLRACVALAKDLD